MRLLQEALFAKDKRIEIMLSFIPLLLFSSMDIPFDDRSPLSLTLPPLTTTRFMLSYYCIINSLDKFWDEIH